MHSPLILAVDTDDLEVAKKWISLTSPYIGVFKLGLEFFLKFGISGIMNVKAETDSKIFLDLKLHDIPNTVGAAAKQVQVINPEFLTVHASGGPAMVAAAVAALPETKITAVTILTSLDKSDLDAIGFVGSAAERAAKLAELAVSAGAGAIVSSPQEILKIRSAIGNRALIITPGVRPKASANDDQKRTMDPRSAIEAGADYLVIGRPITGSANIADAARSILEEALN